MADLNIPNLNMKSDLALKLGGRDCLVLIILQKYLRFEPLKEMFLLLLIKWWSIFFRFVNRQKWIALWIG